FDDDHRVTKRPRIGGYNDPQPEAVLAVKPDLVLAEPAPANRGPVETVARLGVPIEAFPLATVQDIEDAIAGIANLLGVPEKGRTVDEQIEKARARARSAAAGQPRARAGPRQGARRDPAIERAAPSRPAHSRGARRPRRGPEKPMKHSAATRAGLAVALLLPLVAAALAAGLATGAGELSLRAALNGQEPDATVLFRLRVPRVLLAAEVGAALSVAGVALQALLRNPLADPFVFGLSGGAAIGIAIVTVASGSAIGAAAASAASFAGVLPTP